MAKGLDLPVSHPLTNIIGLTSEVQHEMMALLIFNPNIKDANND